MGLVKIKSKKIEEKIVKQLVKGIYRPMIRSRHPSHNPFRTQLIKLPFRSVIRFGSLTELEDISTKNGSRIELNSPESIKNSSNKLKMKQCFDVEKVKTAEWKSCKTVNEIKIFADKVGYPIVSKHHFGSKGTGNKLLKNAKEVEDFFIKNDKNIQYYIFEKYCNFNKEYRLHVTTDGCFYTCRKMLRQEFKEHPNSWQRHDDNCVWILEENENFDKPINWNEIIKHCVQALKACGLDFGACDLRVQNNLDSEGRKRTTCDFIVVEINSAPSMGTITLEKYKEKLPELLNKKYNEKK
jgi:carbamoylphosphate synthase large subunit